jgi:molecular chaperone GrpE
MTTDPNTKADPQNASQAASSGTPPVDPSPLPTGDVPDLSVDSGLGQLQADLERFRDLALRTQADFENYRKRAAREKDDAVRYANFALVEKLLPILDNFDLGLNAAKSSEGGGSIVQGMEMVRKQLDEFLAQIGVEVVPAEGTVFDPNIHEAVGQQPHAELAEGMVVRQLRRGFRLRDRLVRAAMVLVSSGPA